MSSQINALEAILSSPRSVFNTQSLRMLTECEDCQKLTKSLHYYVRTGKIRNPRRGIYTKASYDEREMACSLFRPAYFSYFSFGCQTRVNRKKGTQPSTLFPHRQFRNGKRTGETKRRCAVLYIAFPQDVSGKAIHLVQRYITSRDGCRHCHQAACSTFPFH